MANGSQAAISVSDIVARSNAAQRIAVDKISSIRTITRRMKILALNALIEAGRAGDAGRGFAIVSNEVKDISTEFGLISDALETELAAEIGGLAKLAANMAETAQGTRMIDLALNAIELVDRNLYERSCDVRWWATDAAFVQAAESPSALTAQHASDRLAVILKAYTVYLDLWLIAPNGEILANGRPNAFSVAQKQVADRNWFKRGMSLATGDDFHAEDTACEPLLDGAQVSTFVTPVRRGGASHGAATGLLAIHFDWEPQARTIVQGIRLTDDEVGRTRVLLVDANRRIIAASDNRGLLTDRFDLKTDGTTCGHYRAADGRVVAFHKTPGYETYAGLGWYGVIEQRPI